MAHIKRKYIDNSHWLVFIFKAFIALVFGCVTLLHPTQIQPH